MSPNDLAPSDQNKLVTIIAVGWTAGRLAIAMDCGGSLLVPAGILIGKIVAIGRLLNDSQGR
jgi:hypothetical protein